MDEIKRTLGNMLAAILVIAGMWALLVLIFGIATYA